MKKHFNKELVMTKENNENFESSTKCWIFYNAFRKGYVKVKDRCHVIGKYRGATYRDCNIKIILNH